MTPAEAYLLQETKKFTNWAVAQGYVDNDDNAKVLSKWLDVKGYPMTFDSLVSAFAQCKDRLQFKSNRKDPPNLTQGFGGSGQTNHARREETETTSPIRSLLERA